jgi:hypothetical protein
LLIFPEYQNPKILKKEETGRCGGHTQVQYSASGRALFEPTKREATENMKNHFTGEHNVIASEKTHQRKRSWYLSLLSVRTSVSEHNYRL